MKAMLTNVHHCFIGNNRAYIYIIFSRVWNFAYVGETNSANGVIGRLNEHVSASGTLRTQLQIRQGINLDEVHDLTVFSYVLPSSPEYVSIEKVYRRGVEYLIQDGLWGICGEIKPYLQPISNVQYSDACSLRSVRTEAATMLEEFVSLY